MVSRIWSAVLSTPTTWGLAFQVSMIASIGSAVVLLVFMLVSAAHFRVRSQTIV